MPLNLSLDVIAMIFDLSALCEGAGALQQTALPLCPWFGAGLAPALGSQAVAAGRMQSYTKRWPVSVPYALKAI